MERAADLEGGDQGRYARVPVPAAVSREPVSWLLWRHDLKEYFRALGAAEEDALATALSGETFGDVCAVMCAHFREDEAPAEAAGVPARLDRREWLGPA